MYWHQSIFKWKNRTGWTCSIWMGKVAIFALATSRRSTGKVRIYWSLYIPIDVQKFMFTLGNSHIQFFLGPFQKKYPSIISKFLPVPGQRSNKGSTMAKQMYFTHQHTSTSSQIGVPLPSLKLTYITPENRPLESSRFLLETTIFSGNC